MFTENETGQATQGNLAKPGVAPKTRSVMQNTISGPRRWPLVGNLPEFMLDAYKFLSKASHKYGAITKFHLPLLGTTYFVSKPEYIEQLMLAKPDALVRPNLYKVTTPLLGGSLPLADGEAWLMRRRLMQPAFHKERILGYSTTMIEQTAKLLERWQANLGRPQTVDEDMAQITVDIVTSSLLSTNLSTYGVAVGDALRKLMHWINKRPYSLIQLPLSIPTPGNRQFRKIAHELEELVYKIIAEHRANNSLDDLLARCMSARNPLDGSQLSDKELRDEVMTLLLAGQDSTSRTLTWTLYLLALHPEIEAKVHAELDEVLGGRSPGTDDLPKLRYTGLVFREVLRLYPVLWFVGRQATQDFKLGDYVIPAGSTIMTSPWIIQHKAEFYADPDEFRPERWLEPQIKNLHKFTYFPFGGGSRVCMGSDFAMQEMALIIAMTGQRFKLRFVEANPNLKPIVGLTLIPPEGLKMRLIPRNLEVN